MVKKVRILVIDDDAVACEFLQEALSRAGYEVDVFTSAREALKRPPRWIPWRRVALCAGGLALFVGVFAVCDLLGADDWPDYVTVPLSLSILSG